MKHSNCNLVIRLRELRDNTPHPLPACQLACLPKLMCASSLRRRLILFCFGFFSPRDGKSPLKNESPHASATSLPTKNTADALVGYFRPRHHVSISSQTVSPAGATQSQTRSQRDIMRLNDGGWPLTLCRPAAPTSWCPVSTSPLSPSQTLRNQFLLNFLLSVAETQFQPNLCPLLETDMLVIASPPPAVC